MKSHATKFALPLVAAALALGLAACGGSESGNDETTVSGKFQPLPGAPRAYAKLAGSADLVRDEEGTTASISLTGLEPETEYVAHLHTGGCDQPDPGGPHFKFDPQGGDEPPNELHLELTSDGSGAGSARTASKREVPVGEAGSIVLHTASSHVMAAFVHEGHDHGGGGEAGPEAIACAELEGAGAAASLPTIVIRNGEPVGGVKQLEYTAGEDIRFKVESDKAEEIHLHGYDVMKDVPAGGSVTFDVPAEIEGIFEAEMEGTGIQIAEIQVNP
ncbi:MAG TPA: hypothetical protein VHA54_10085 [Solirubrobacterales bacterium]|nr:hypothetical protein [Solirubrobacterales bacterium]